MMMHTSQVFTGAFSSVASLVNLVPNGEIWDAVPPLSFEEPFLPVGTAAPVGFVNSGTTARYGLDADGHMHVLRGGGNGPNANLNTSFIPEAGNTYRAIWDFASSHTNVPPSNTVEGNVLLNIQGSVTHLIPTSYDVPETGLEISFDFTPLDATAVNFRWRGTSSQSYTVIKSFKLYKLT